ncbi:DUF4352 domain-containing protein [Streptomyces specialis]|uniref:hypothetical protein n=1 Tax=Streptomyces specialis TaxID=498367 RepID=UPI00073E952B|nr:hypothetical protein [Streptomyces specialis]
MRFRAVTATVAAVLAAALTVSACGDGGGKKRSRIGDDDDSGSSSSGGFDADDDAGTDGPGDEPEGPGTTELTPGQSYTWEEQGLTVTVGPASRYTGTDPADFLVEGETAFTVDVTIVNEGSAPADLADLRFTAETPDGTPASTASVAGAGFLTGTLAPGDTEEAVQAWSLDTAAHGSDVVIVGSWFADIDTARWLTAIP